MVDRELILVKAGAVRRHCKRIREKTSAESEVFTNDLDRQEIVVFNLQMAIQKCIDIAAHIVSEEGYGVPGSSNEMFYMLEENHLLDKELTEKMVKAIGLRNLIVHEYGAIDMEKIYHLCCDDIADLEDFIKDIVENIG